MLSKKLYQVLSIFTPDKVAAMKSIEIGNLVLTHANSCFYEKKVYWKQARKIATLVNPGKTSSDLAAFCEIYRNLDYFVNLSANYRNRCSNC